MRYVIDARNAVSYTRPECGIVRDGYDCDPDGHRLGINETCLTFDGCPWYPIAGECHYSRLDPDSWDDALAMMAAGGVNVVSTYVLWNHHEDVEGSWDFTGRRDLRRFVERCAAHGLYVIVRIGPFCHGEVRNGGLPDWLYGKPYQVRSTDPGFLNKVRELYRRIAAQLEGLYYRDGGPIIAAQLDNEYMSSSAPWEMTTGVSREWVPGGDEGVSYLHALRDIAIEQGIDVPFFTCTGWGAPVPEDMLPLWGGYAYRPWLFYERSGDHPLTDEYLYRCLHGTHVTRYADFNPDYDPDSRPYACCEMGGGMFNAYRYRFVLPLKSVDAMANIKIGSGCNFLGYYMFRGGTNPLDSRGGYLNESQTPKRSYDFQAALGEFGQVRESYRRLRTIHAFMQAFGDRVIPLPVILPDGQDDLDPADMHTLRFSVRSDGHRGYLFVNNFQDHASMTPKHGQSVAISLKQGRNVTFEGLGLEDQENCILPFNMDLDGVTLRWATVQPVTVVRLPGASCRSFVFLKPPGMDVCRMVFDDDSQVAEKTCTERIIGDGDVERFTVRRDGAEAEIIVLSRQSADRMLVVDGQALAFCSDGATLYPSEEGCKVRAERSSCTISTIPQGYLRGTGSSPTVSDNGVMRLTWREDTVKPVVERIHDDRFRIDLPGIGDLLDRDGVSEVLLRIEYVGDIGWLFCGDELIHDNFCNGEPWEIGLREWRNRIETEGLTLVITPLKPEATVNVDSPMAARIEQVGDHVVASVRGVSVHAVYQTVMCHDSERKFIQHV